MGKASREKRIRRDARQAQDKGTSIARRLRQWLTAHRTVAATLAAIAVAAVIETVGGFTVNADFFHLFSPRIQISVASIELMDIPLSFNGVDYHLFRHWDQTRGCTMATIEDASPSGLFVLGDTNVRQQFFVAIANKGRVAASDVKIVLRLEPTVEYEEEGFPTGLISSRATTKGSALHVVAIQTLPANDTYLLVYTGAPLRHWDGPASLQLISGSTAETGALRDLVPKVTGGNELGLLQGTLTASKKAFSNTFALELDSSAKPGRYPTGTMLIEDENTNRSYAHTCGTHHHVGDTLPLGRFGQDATDTIVVSRLPNGRLDWTLKPRT